MIGYLSVILLCQLIGEILTRLLRLPVPGPVIGMVILFCGLSLRRGLPADLEAVTGFLHRYLALLFVPAGVGIITSLDLLRRAWLPLAGAIVVGTALTIATTGLIMQAANKRRQSQPDEVQP